MQKSPVANTSSPPRNPLDKTRTSEPRRTRLQRLIPVAMALLFFAPTPIFAVPPLPEFPIPTPSSADSSQAWSVDCKTGCEMRTVLRGNQPNAPEILRMRIRRADKDVWDIAITTPLALFLPDPLSLIPEASVPISVPWYTCGSSGCEARVTPNPDLLRQLKRGRTINMELSLLDRTRVRLPVSLAGFTAAFRDLSVRSAP